MDKQHLEKVEGLFRAAVELPVEQRAKFLADECVADTGLRSEVDALLRFDTGEPAFLDSPPASLAAEIFSNDESDPLLAVGQIGRYRLERLLGEGGMGKVYLAEDMRLHRRVALKVLPHRFVIDADRLRRFEREAQAASALNHPNILTVHEFAEDDGLHYIASEFVEGQTVRQRLSAGPIEVAESLEIAIQAASALAAAHEAGITHRDIKPENLMIRPDGYVKVLDFGLAKHGKGSAKSFGSGSEDPTRHLLDTEPGLIMGTESYMSPEQARGLKVDSRTDIWSLGVVIYEMLTGQRPFNGDTRADTIVSVLSADPAPFDQSLAYPHELEKMVRRALSKDVDERHQSANELRAELVEIKRSVEERGDRSTSPGEGRPGNKNTGSAVHSTLGTGFPTQPDAEEKLEESGETYTFTGPRPIASGSSSFLGISKSLDLRSLIGAAILLVLVSTGVYFAFFAGGTRGIDSVAVLPFEDLTGSSEISNFSGSIADVITDRLSQLPQLRVVSRSSTARFKPGEYELSSAADQLGVRALVTGKITRSGDDVLVRVEIVDAVEDRHLAGIQFQRPLSGISLLQSEIAHSAARQLQLKLTDEQQKRLSLSETEDQEAYQYYLSGLVELNGQQGARSRALEHFLRAVEIDPDFSAAHAEIGWIYAARANASDNPHELMPLARSAAERALSLNPENAKAHVVMAMTRESEFDWRAAESEYQQAIEAAPSLDFPRNNYAFFLSVLNRQDEALAQLEERSLRDPLNRRMALLQKGIVLVQARRFDEALDAYQQARLVEPSREVPAFAVGYAYAGNGQYDEAVEYYRQAIANLGGEGQYSQPLVYLSAAYARIHGKQKESRVLLERIEAMEGYRSPALLAVPHAALGDINHAMELLEEAYINRDPLLRYIAVGYEYDDFRTNPRFSDLIKRVGLVGQNN